MSIRILACLPAFSLLAAPVLAQSLPDAPASGLCGQPAALNAARLDFDAVPAQPGGAFVALARNEPRYVELNVTAPVALTMATDTALTDTTLILFDENGAVVQSDDDSGFDENARIAHRLEVGGYCLQVGQYGELDATPVTIPVAISGAPAPDSCVAMAGEPVEFGAGNDEIITPGFLTGTARTAVSVPAGAPLTIEVRSPVFDTYLTIENDIGQIIAEDDDGGDDTNSRVELPASETDTTYCISLTGYEGGEGVFAMSIAKDTTGGSAPAPDQTDAEDATPSPDTADGTVDDAPDDAPGDEG